MLRRSLFVFLFSSLIVTVIFAQVEKKKAPPKMPEIVGAWTGDWGPYDPAQGTAIEKAKCKQLDCSVVLQEGFGSAKVWEATFEGECGRPYKYTIKMEGRQASETVMFKGTEEFAGFYTSSHHVGVFRLARAK